VRILTENDRATQASNHVELVVVPHKIVVRGTCAPPLLAQ